MPGKTAHVNYLYVLVFTTGAVTLGVELSAARLLAPWFGNSQVVWAALIGMILFYLAVGAWLGGKWADRYPTLKKLALWESMWWTGADRVSAG